MYGVIGEDKSDVESLTVLIRRIAGNESLQVKRKGFGGCGQMLKKGARQLQLQADRGMTRFIVCYDSDGHAPVERREEAMRRIIRPSGLKDFCITIPVQEMEAWILADLSAVSNVIPSWKPTPHSNPESVRSPKDFIERESRSSKKKHATAMPFTTLAWRCISTLRSSIRNALPSGRSAISSRARTPDMSGAVSVPIVLMSDGFRNRALVYYSRERVCLSFELSRSVGLAARVVCG